MSVVQVRFVRKALEDRFTDLIDMSDQHQLGEASRHQAFLSRGLAALAAQIEHPCSDSVAVRSVFDGKDDRGLDAIAVDADGMQPRITLIQAKWSDKGKGGFGEAEVHKMLHGLDLILDLDFSRFNGRFQPHTPALEKIFEGGRTTPKITLVLALMRSEPISRDVRDLLERKIKKYNDVEEMVDYKVLDLKDFHRAILGDAAAPKIDAKLRLEGFGQESSPYKALYGTMAVPDIADLYGEHRRGLFARNIRDSLDLTDVNVKIRNTLLNEPEHFWYFSNGITMLCEIIKPTGKAVLGGVGDFQVTGASVVNGAQTVSAIHRAYTEDPDTAQRGRVMVRLISLQDCPAGFGDQVTTSTNTQNPIEERDFKSLDPGQITLREVFAASLGLTYVIKRGEGEPEPESGTTISEAAEALAAAHADVEYAAMAKQDVKRLWEEEAYQALFGPSPDAYRVWRCVQLLRRVRAELDHLWEGLVGRGAMMASYGDLLITHVIYRQLDTRGLENPEFDWDAQLARVSGLVGDALAWSLQAIDAEFGSTSHIIAAARNTERISRVARAALRGMLSGAAAPEVNAQYQAADDVPQGRRSNAVKTVVAASVIEDGTILEYRPYSRSERRDLADWLAADPDRGLAEWRNHGVRPLRWKVDGAWYSPSGLSRLMRATASGVDQATQGTLHWYVPGEGNLLYLAEKVRAERGLVVDEELEGEA